MRPILMFHLSGMLLMLACNKGQRPAPAGEPDTTRDRGDTAALRRPSPADTQDGASLKDTLHRPRPTGMQRSEGGAAPGDKARRDSAPRVAQ